METPECASPRHFVPVMGDEGTPVIRCTSSSESPLLSPEDPIRRSLSRLRRTKSLLNCAPRLAMIHEYPMLSVDFSGVEEDPESREACYFLCEAIDLREKYMLAMRAPPPMCKARLYTDDDGENFDIPRLDRVPTADEFLRDFDRLQQICARGPVVSYCLKRLAVLQYNFEFYKLLNDKREAEACKKTGMDLSKLTKVDTHIHLAAAMSEEQLLQFILKKLRTCPDEVVLTGKDGEPRTLKQVFDGLGLDETSLNVHALGVRAGSSAFQRFDNFNALYNPFGNSDLRTIFLKTNNVQKGKYFAELTKEVFRAIAPTSKKTELRVSIYGRSPNEWNELAAWVERFDVRSPSNRWLIQVPRTYSVWFAQGRVHDFQEFLDNVFGPLFDITEHPEHDPALVAFLRDVSGFDSVDDESKPDIRIDTRMLEPKLWNIGENPPYYYYMYHMYANIARLNQIRESRGLETFDFRPHCGESGSERHVLAAFLTATGINHGIMLDKTPVAQYLYYLCYIGICVSPLSNNNLFLNYSSNPFPLFFKRGLNVSLSTDDPLQFHYTQTPLIEEYAIASRFWDLNSVDLSEIAKNSVLHCGFPRALKEQWYGPLGTIPGISANDPQKTNVPLIRTHFRSNNFDEETRLLLTLSVHYAREHDSPLLKIVLPEKSSVTQHMLSECTQAVVTYPNRDDNETKVEASPEQQLSSVVLAVNSDIVANRTERKDRNRASMPAPPEINLASPDAEDQLYYSSIHIQNSILMQNDVTNVEVFVAIPLLEEAITMRKKHQKMWFDRESPSFSRPFPRYVRNLSFRERIQRPGMLARAFEEEPAIIEAMKKPHVVVDGLDNKGARDDMNTVLPFQNRLGNFSKLVYSMKDGVFIVYDSQEVFCTNDETRLATVYCTQCQADFCEGCFEVLHRSESKKGHRAVRHAPAAPVYVPISFEEYARDFVRLMHITRNGPVMTTCWKRNHMLEERYNFHMLLHEKLEKRAVQSSGTDLYRIVKVDNHIHLNRAVSGNMLLSFVKRKVETEGDEVVMSEWNGRKNVTLNRMFKSIGLDPSMISLENMATQASGDTFHRYDIWTEKSALFGRSGLRNLFLSYNNEQNGRFFAELLNDELYGRMMRDDPSLYFEFRVGVHDLGGYARLAKWAVENGITKWERCRFLIQLSRDYPKQYAKGVVHSFGEYLTAIFAPLFEVTKDSSTSLELEQFLEVVSGFDCIGNEGGVELAFVASPDTLPPPDEWTSADQPPYAYYLYYLNANIQSLNNFRLLTGRNIFDFRPHCGETGDPAHLAAAYLTGKNIAHGTQLTENSVLSYLYYVNQIGISASPLSESATHMMMRTNPFIAFFKRGLNISLSTDTPLHIHMTNEPILEEYATAAQMWKLSLADLCEIARNSVRQSGFRPEEKEAWLGPRYNSLDISGHDLRKTSVPTVRMRFRMDSLLDEFRFLQQTNTPNINAYLGKGPLR